LNYLKAHYVCDINEYVFYLFRKAKMCLILFNITDGKNRMIGFSLCPGLLEISGNFKDMLCSSLSLIFQSHIFNKIYKTLTEYVEFELINYLLEASFPITGQE
jgi:hypothetical protein